MNKSTKTLIKRYGENYFSELGKKGAKAFYKKYYLMPIGTSRFGIFRRDNGQFVNCLGYDVRSKNG